MRQAVQASRDALVGYWLLTICALVAVMILVGGATRLTGSGLSITEWKPVTGAIPPLSAAHWSAEFEKYRQTTQFRLVNPDIGLGDFKLLYWWEWGHRFLGRLIGVVFAAPFLAFWALGRLKGRFWGCVALLGLGALQGAIGWWMVQSGLSGRISVAPARLAVHLGVAFVILALGWRLALAALGWPAARGAGGARLAWIFAAALFAQILLGAIVAGSDAGPAYADWPTIGGEWFPRTYAAMEHAAIQFNHRVGGYLVWALAVFLAWRAWREPPGAARAASLAVFALATLQAGLGIATILAGSPLSLSLIHQGGAIALWLAAHAVIAAKTMR
ncbi:MAG: COX15/CtaA family protein [Hyphomonadaceae bacterium]